MLLLLNGKVENVHFVLQEMQEKMGKFLVLVVKEN